MQRAATLKSKHRKEIWSNTKSFNIFFFFHSSFLDEIKRKWRIINKKKPTKNISRTKIISAIGFQFSSFWCWSKLLIIYMYILYVPLPYLCIIFYTTSLYVLWMYSSSIRTCNFYTYKFYHTNIFWFDSVMDRHRHIWKIWKEW